MHSIKTIMPAFQLRVVEESEELLTKIVKLDAFRNGEFFRTLPVDEQERLQLQRSAMMMYCEILQLRINHF